jgi:hypothetical protein
MKDVPVSVRPENMIVIEQDDHRGDTSIVVLHSDQSETVCKWMKEARDEAVRGERSGDLRGLVVGAGQGWTRWRRRGGHGSKLVVGGAGDDGETAWGRLRREHAIPRPINQVWLRLGCGLTSRAATSCRLLQSHSPYRVAVPWSGRGCESSDTPRRIRAEPRSTATR